jgi:hypothetical protein
MEAEETAEGLSIDPRERRAYPRYDVDEEAVLLLLSHGLPLQSHILDLSLEGCRMRTRERFTAGARTRAEVTFKVNGVAFRFVGVIQWTDGRNLVGIRFVEMISRRREQLAEVVGEMEAAAAARAEKEAAERSTAERLAGERAGEQTRREAQEQAAREADEQAERAAREQAEREAREWAEIQAIARQARPVRQEAAAPENEPKGSKRDRRAQARHEVDTSATIYLVKMGAKLEGRILDLSVSGCRIRTEERFLVGIYTRVEAGFYLNGMPFRLGGVIQAIHDRHHVGIRFLDLSDRNRERVEELIEEIEAMRKAGE